MAKKVFNAGNTDYTRQISEYAVSMKYEGIPADVLERAKMMTLHTIGVSLAAANVKQAETSVLAARRLNGGSGGGATVWTTGEKLSPAAACFVNGTVADMLDWEDCAWTGHPSAGVIPVAVAMSEELHKSGKDFLTAVVAGYEAYTRIAMSVQPPADFDHAHGWGIVSWQMFASVIPAAKLLGLDALKTNQAYGMGCIYTPIASNLMQATMSNAYHYQHGLAAHSGILAAYNALDGIDNLTDGLDIPYAYSEQLTTEEKRYWIVKDLDKFLMTNILIKHWPANMWIQTPIEIVHDLAKEHAINPADIAEIIVDPPTQYRMQFYEDGFSSLMDAQFSMPFCIATMLYGDKPGPNWYSPELFTDPRIIDLARRIKGGPSKEDTLQGSFVLFQNGQFPEKHVTITMKDGAVYERAMSKHKGHPDNMLTRREFCDLFLNNAAFHMSRDKAVKLMDFILNMENVEDMAEIGKRL
ncbi:MAG: MmgE/PrpD family protein [Clostridiales bacterium]|nr:MmgE/PrpD family protein [Clostridiales bacterium]